MKVCIVCPSKRRKRAGNCRLESLKKEESVLNHSHLHSAIVVGADH
jgi:hypothetical protein